MSRALVLKLAARLKTIGSIDTLIRYNPFINKRVFRALEAYRNQLYSGDFQNQLIKNTLLSATKTSYGKDKGNTINEWPILERATLSGRSSDFINPHSLVKIPASTGGTSGVPLQLWRSLECVMAEQAFLNNLLHNHGMAMNTSRLAILRADAFKAIGDKTPPYGIESHSGKRLTLSSYHLNPETIHWFHEAIERFSPSILWVYPSAVVNLLGLLQKANLRLSIPVIMASSEALSGLVHTALEDYFQCTVINYYGQAERVCFAHSVKANEFYFNPCYGLVEFEEQDTDSEGKSIRIIGTGFWNSAMPLVRYDTGDLLYVPQEYSLNELKEVAAGQRPFEGLSGRAGEYLLTREGMRIVGLNHIPREIKAVAQIQLVQSGFDTLFVNVLAMPGFNKAESMKLLNQAKAKAPDNMRVELRVVDKLRTTQRGKTPFVIRDI